MHRPDDARPVTTALRRLCAAALCALGSASAAHAQQATSLLGVLALVPGVPLQPPGLDGIQQFSLRSATSQGGGSLVSGDLASFGTVIILDGVPLSNNANLQTLGSGSQLSFGTTAGGGIDLRRIPANTIERVEVIRGLQSARWGDLTQARWWSTGPSTRFGPAFHGSARWALQLLGTVSPIRHCCP